MTDASTRAAAALRGAVRALRGFLAGFTGMPSPRLDAPCARCGAAGASRAARDALGARAERRQSCC